MRFPRSAYVARVLAMAFSVAPAAASAQSGAGPGAVDISPPPEARPDFSITATTSNVAPELGFSAWIASFRARALASGIPAAIYDGAMDRVIYNPAVVRLDSGQAEFGKQIWDYLDTAVSDLRVSNGRAALAEHEALLSEIEARYGVEKEIVAAIWGMETAYGSFAGDVPTLGALASLAYDGRRAAFFEAQLIDALHIVQAGDVAAENMIGSWAGAMGHTQFMPGSYLEYAVDFTGDGKRDIWGEDPADALASTAAYLKRHGWRTGQPWGIEVVLPEGFDYALADGRVERPASFWNALGIRGAAGQQVPTHGPVSILLPAGHRGVAFAIFGNFHVLERYNAADAYVIGVGHLADRIAGGGPFAADWPRDDRALSFDEKEELQRRLLLAGFDPGGIDGIVGPGTAEAVRAFQTSEGLVPDGYASGDLLTRLR